MPEFFNYTDGMRTEEQKQTLHQTTEEWKEFLGSIEPRMKFEAADNFKPRMSKEYWELIRDNPRASHRGFETLGHIAHHAGIDKDAEKELYVELMQKGVNYVMAHRGHRWHLVQMHMEEHQEELEKIGVQWPDYAPHSKIMSYGSEPSTRGK